jgi:hypothetical protein
MLASAAKFDAAGGEVGRDELRLQLVSLLRQHPEISELRWIGADGKEQFLESRLGLNLDGSGRGRVETVLACRYVYRATV